MQELRYYQKEAVDAILNHEDNSVCCVVMPCGTGKTTVMSKVIEMSTPKLTVIVFPRLALIDQYMRSYLLNNITYIPVGSTGYSATKDANLICNMVEENSCCVILTTYVSIIELSKILGHVNYVIYDESHHTNTNKQDEAAAFLDPGKTIYFTATPVDNHHNIIYRYSYDQALQDGFSRPFMINVYVTAQPKSPKTIYEMLGYFAEKLNLSNTICFHRYSNIIGCDSGTSVDDFVRYQGIVGDGAGAGAGWDLDGEENADAEHDLTTFLPDGAEIVCIKGKTPIDERVQILERAKEVDAYTIMHTCKTMSEGIDTQKITSICIIDELNDEIATTQAIGRIMRKDFDNPDEPSHLLIPFFGVEGRGGDGTCDHIEGEATTELKKRSAERKFEKGGKIDDNGQNVPRYMAAPNETFDINLNMLKNHNQIKTISGILSFFAKDNPENDKTKLGIDDLHKKISAFEIATHNGERKRAQPKIRHYGHMEALNNRSPKEMMMYLAKRAVDFIAYDKSVGRRTGTPNVYAFIDFVASVVENDDPRYQRYIELEDLFDKHLGKQWEYGVYWKPVDVDDRIIDIITNNRFGFPVLAPDKFNKRWKKIFKKSTDDKDFINKWMADKN